MKTAGKVFLIIGIIAAAIVIAISVAMIIWGFSQQDTYTAGYGFSLIGQGIFGVIIGKKTLATTKVCKPPVWMCVLTIIFCNVLAGIFLLCSNEEDYNPQPVSHQSASVYEVFDFNNDPDQLGKTEDK